MRDNDMDKILIRKWANLCESSENREYDNFVARNGIAQESENGGTVNWGRHLENHWTDFRGNIDPDGGKYQIVCFPINDPPTKDVPEGGFPDVAVVATSDRFDKELVDRAVDWLISYAKDHGIKLYWPNLHNLRETLFIEQLEHVLKLDMGVVDKDTMKLDYDADSFWKYFFRAKNETD